MMYYWTIGSQMAILERTSITTVVYNWRLVEERELVAGGGNTPLTWGLMAVGIRSKNRSMRLRHTLH